jgi:transcriptional regulator with XRE-family HTH domain
MSPEPTSHRAIRTHLPPLNRLRERRLRSRLTQEVLAAAARLSVGLISEAETGKRELTAAQQAAVDRAFARLERSAS